MKNNFLVGAIVLSCIFTFIPVPAYAAKGISGSEVVTLEKCVDGDTANFKDSSGTTFKTRFLAVDTPETVHPTKGVEPFGKDASNYTCESLTNAKEIKLEYDAAAGKEDKYGRRLAWVFVDGVLLQEKLIELGYAEVDYLYGDYQYTGLLQDTQTVAKTSKVGIWSDEALSTDAEAEDEEKEETTEKEKTTKEQEKKSWIQELVDYVLGEIFKYIDKLLEKIVKAIESML